MELIVECYSGHTYAQEPRAFVLGDSRYRVVEVIAAWREPQGPCFLVRADDDRRYELKYDEAGDTWQIRLQT